MVLRSHKLKWFAAVLAIVLAAMAVGGVVLKRYSDAKFKKLVESKALREATVTVMRKERVRFDKTNNEYDGIAAMKFIEKQAPKTYAFIIVSIVSILAMSLLAIDCLKLKSSEMPKESGATERTALKNMMGSKLATLSKLNISASVMILF